MRNSLSAAKYFVVPPNLANYNAALPTSKVPTPARCLNTACWPLPARSVGGLLDDFSSGRIQANRDVLSADLVEIFRAMLAAADDAEVSLDQAARLNVAKTLGRWPVTPDWGALFDVDFPPEEQLPRQITTMQNKGSRFDLAD